MTGTEKPSGKALRTAAGILLTALLLLSAPAAVSAAGEQIIVSELTLSLCELQVIASPGLSFTIDGQQTTSALVITGGQAEVTVSGIPSRATLETQISPGAEIIVNGSTITVQNIRNELVTLTLRIVRTEPDPSPSPSGGGSPSIFLPDPVDPDTPDTPAEKQAKITAELTESYRETAFTAAAAAEIAAVQAADPVLAAELASKIEAAELAGYPLTNSRGAPALAGLGQQTAEAASVKFARVYDLSPAHEGEKVTQVEIPVPITDITASGLTWEDVHIYHYTESVDMWIPLEIISVTFDEENYYYTAETDGASPFGVLIKHFDAPQGPGLPAAPKTPAPAAGVIAGLGAAAAVLSIGVRRK